MDEIRLFPIRIFDLFLCNVLPCAVEHLAGIRRNQKSWHSGNAVVDIQAPVALGLPWNAVL